MSRLEFWQANVPAWSALTQKSPNTPHWQLCKCKDWTRESVDLLRISCRCPSRYKAKPYVSIFYFALLRSMVISNHTFRSHRPTTDCLKCHRLFLLSYEQGYWNPCGTRTSSAVLRLFAVYRGILQSFRKASRPLDQVRLRYWICNVSTSGLKLIE